MIFQSHRLALFVRHKLHGTLFDGTHEMTVDLLDSEPRSRSESPPGSPRPPSPPIPSSMVRDRNRQHSELDHELEMLRKQRMLLEEERKLLLERRKLEMLKNETSVPDYRTDYDRKTPDYRDRAGKPSYRMSRSPSPKRRRESEPYRQQSPPRYKRMDEPPSRQYNHPVKDAKFIKAPYNPKFGPKKPLFANACNLIIKDMKKKLPYLEFEDSKLKGQLLSIVNSVLQRRIQKLLINKPFVKTIVIVKWYRRAHPAVTDNTFVQTIAKKLKAQMEQLEPRSSNVDKKSSNERLQTSSSGHGAYKEVDGPPAGWAADTTTQWVHEEQVPRSRRDIGNWTNEQLNVDHDNIIGIYKDDEFDIEVSPEDY